MKSMNPADPRPARVGKRARGSTLVATLVILLGLSGCGEHQIGDDKESFKTVEALYTAVSLRELPKVEDCSARLKALKDSGKLSEGASGTLDAVIAKAREGQWEHAQQQLSTFMKGQHR